MTLTTKQLAQIAKAPAARKEALRAAFTRQNAQQRGAPPQTRQPGAKARASRASATLPCPSVPRPLAYAFDAFDKRHLPLDEITAPYTTTSFITTMDFTVDSSMDKVAVICPRLYGAQESVTGPLTDFIGMLYDAHETVSGTIPILQYVRSPVIDAPAQGASVLLTSVRGRLHNLSARVECLGTNAGLIPPGSVYAGTVPMIETGVHSTGHAEGLRIKQAWADDSIAVGYLRSVPAAALTNNPLTLHAAVAENVSYKSWRDFSVPPTAADLGSLSFNTSLEPIVVYFPRVGSGAVVNYRIVIGQQWCTRHPNNIMLRSTQKQHPATAPSVWHQAVSAVKDVGEHLLERAGNAAMAALADQARATAALALPNA